MYLLSGRWIFLKFYEKYYASNYEELITYYPRFYRDVFEMVEILKAHGRIADSMEENIEQTYLNGFIDYADEVTIAKLERFLGIGLNRNLTLEERRRLVKSYFVGFGKISATLIKQMIGAYSNAPVDCRFEPFDEEKNNALYVRIYQDDHIDEIITMLSRKIPAHINFVMVNSRKKDTNVYIGGTKTVCIKIVAAPEPTQYKVQRDVRIDMGVGTLEHVRAVYRPGKGE